jgi:hypothetical protein
MQERDRYMILMRLAALIGFFLFRYNKVSHFRCSGHKRKPRLDDLAGFLFDLLKIEFYDFPGDCSDFGKWHPASFRHFDGFVVDRNVAMKAFELDGLVGSIGGDTDKFSGGEATDLAGWDCKVELEALAAAAVAGVGADAVLFLQYTAESFGDLSG